MDLKFYSGEAHSNETVLHAVMANLENAVIAVFWEGTEPRFGTLTLSLPNRMSSVLLGDRDGQLCQLLGSQITALTGKMALVTLNLNMSTGDLAGKILLELARDISNKLIKGKDD
jgi:hypothetical protein